MQNSFQSRKWKQAREPKMKKEKEIKYNKKMLIVFSFFFNFVDPNDYQGYFPSHQTVNGNFHVNVLICLENRMKS